VGLVFKDYGKEVFFGQESLLRPYSKKKLSVG